MKCRFLIALATIALASTALADDTMTPNPDYQSWAKFKPGTNIQLSVQNTSQSDATTMTMTETLRSVADDEATIEIRFSILAAGKKIDAPPTDRQIPALIKPTAIPSTQNSDAPEVQTAADTITTAGKTYPCTRTTTTSQANGMTTVSTVWRCPDVPGTIVKSEAQSSGATLTISSKTLLTGFHAQ